MGINSESDVSANLQIGPTSLGMVRIYVETETAGLPLDFEPDEAEEIAEEIRAAAARAREMGQSGGGPGRSGKEPKGKGREERRRDGKRQDGGPKRRDGPGSPS